MIIISQIILTMFLTLNAPSTIDTWTPGDTNNYRLTVSVMRGAAHGTLKQYVLTKTPESAWVGQDIQILGSRHKAQALVDRNGKVTRLIVDGTEQPLPEESAIEVIETKETTVTVPAGTFEAIYFDVREIATNKTNQVWVNAKAVPIGGVIKVHSTKKGDVTTELTSFIKK